MKSSFLRIAWIGLLATSLLFISCKERHNDNVKKEQGVENTTDQTSTKIEDAIKNIETDYPNADPELKEKYRDAVLELKSEQQKGKEAAERGDRTEAQKSEEKRKQIQKKINELKNKLEESNDNG